MDELWEPVSLTDDLISHLFSGILRTLYCAKGNYEFGISRVMKSLEPYQKKLGTDTWYYTKRCFLALFENMAKHLILLKDTFVVEIIQFLTPCESKWINLRSAFNLLKYNL